MNSKALKYRQFKLPTSIIKQGAKYIAYSPSLDISTVGNTEKKATERFYELADIFFEELINSGNLENVLSELGWKIEKSVWNPPKIISKKTIGIKIPLGVSA